MDPLVTVANGKQIEKLLRKNSSIQAILDWESKYNIELA